MRSETLVRGGGLPALPAVTIPSIGADATPAVKHTKANYELAAQWTPAAGTVTTNTTARGRRGANG